MARACGGGFNLNTANLFIYAAWERIPAMAGIKQKELEAALGRMGIEATGGGFIKHFPEKYWYGYWHAVGDVFAPLG